MAKTKISEFDSNPANNTDIDGINLAEGMAPGLVNNAIRELMAQLKDQQAGTAGDNFTVGGNLSVTGNTTYSGTLTGSTGVLNIGSGQIYKDASGNVGLGTTSPTNRLTVSGNANVTGSLTAASLAGGASTGSGASGTWGINVSGNSATTSQTNFSNLTIGGNQVLSAANYNNYAPTRTGGGASGTWGINITGNAATVTNGVYNNGGTYSINITGNAGYATNAGNASTVTNGVYNNGGTYSINITGNAATATSQSGGTISASSGYVSGNFVVGAYSFSAGRISITQASTSGYSEGLALMTPTGSHWNLVYGNSNRLYFGQNNQDKAYVDVSTGSWNPVSDRRAKKNISPISYGLNAILALSPVQYNMVVDQDGAKKKLGFIAQDVKAVIDEAVDDPENSDVLLGLDKSVIVPVLVKAIQELAEKVKSLEAKVGV